MPNSPCPEADPAHVWWTQAQPSTFVASPPAPPPLVQAVPAIAAPVWRWGYSRFIGITYGPIPVGLVIAALLLMVRYA